MNRETINSIMSHESFKAPQSKYLHQKRDIEHWSPAKRRKIRDRFLSFCNIVLAYTHYDSVNGDVHIAELRLLDTASPMDSGSSAAESCSSESAGGASFTDDDCRPRRPVRLRNNGLRPSQHQDVPSDDESFELITCYCLKPFAGRPMIECSCCLTWVHLSCAKIRRSNIPEEFTCQVCRDQQISKRTSARARSEKKFATA